jgi:TPR repeat protein
MYRWLTFPFAFVALASAALGQEIQHNVEKPHIYRKAVALCIGIDQYQSRQIRPAGCAENDARDLGELLKSRYGYTPDLLLGEQATRQAILDRLDRRVRELGPEDVLLIFFAGHGQVINLPENRRAGFLIPYDADLDLDDPRDFAQWHRQAIDMQRLIEVVSNSTAKHVLVIADACCSGFMTRRGGLDNRADLQKLLDSPSRMILAATTDKEKARAIGKHGIFTAALLDVLSKNQPLCVTDVLVEVRKRVLRNSSYTMTPTMSRIGKDDSSGELVFLPLVLDRDDVQSAVNDVRRMAAASKRGDGRELGTSAEARRSHIFDALRDRSLERANLRTTFKDVVDAFEGGNYRFADDAAEKRQLWERRVGRLEQNASCGELMAMIAMHYCCSKGLGCEKDDLAAYRWARLAFEYGHVGGKHVLGRCLLYGIGVEKNERAGLKLIRESAETAKPFPISRLQVAIDLCKDRKYAEAHRTLTVALNEGVRQAAIFLADCYLGIMPGGDGFLDDVTPDPKAAIEVLEPAAKKGNVGAQFLLAHAYAWNRDKDGLVKAGEWLQTAAQNGLAAAQSQLARELAGGAYWPVAGDLPLKLGLKRDDKKALEYARLAAQQEDPVAFVLLACYHESRREDEKAIEFCDKAIAKNHPCGMVLKSMWYHTDTIYRPNLEKEIYWAFRAAPSGDSSALVWLGDLYADKAIPKRMLKEKDFAQGNPVYMHYALYYFTQAARKGNPSGLENIKEIVRDPKFGPDAIEWKYFERDYPEAAKRFCQMTGFKP